MTDPRMKTYSSKASFKNAEGLRKKLDGITCGIPRETWHECTFRIKSEFVGLEQKTHSIWYRDIEIVLRFLMGHRPFENDLVYAPVRHFNTDESRIYSEMHTADAWWDWQNKLPPGATVIPMIFGSDKTTLTNHGGDKSVWPVHFTIGNIVASERREVLRPASLVLGLIPIMKDGGPEDKAKVYHEALATMLERRCQYCFEV